MAKYKVRYIVMRKKANKTYYYWTLPKEQQELYGLPSVTLATNVSDGTPQELIESIAVREAEEWNAKYDALRSNPETTLDPSQVRGTFPWLWENFLQDYEKFTSRKPATQKFYKTHVKAILAWSEKAGHPPVGVVTRPACRAFIVGLYNPDPVTSEVKIRTADAVYQTLRRLLTHAYDLGLVQANHAYKLGFSKAKPRKQIWMDDQVEAFIAEALDQERSSLAKAVTCAADLGQREDDILAITKSNYAPETGEVRFVQEKTEAIVYVPVLPDLKREMDEWYYSDEHHHFIINENTGKPYVLDTFRHDFRDVMRDLKDEGNKQDYDDKKIFKYEDLQYRDLRRTAIVNLGRAGCSVPEIVAISGHDVKTCAEILKTYLPQDQQVAQSAVRKLGARRQAQEVQKQSEGTEVTS